MNSTKVYCLGILGVIFFVAPAILGGLQFDEYSHIKQFISESYAIGTPYGNQLRFFGYIPSGIMIALFAFIAPGFLPRARGVKIGFWLFAVFYGFGTIFVGLFPCDEGCNREFIDPSVSQIIHNLVGGLTYLVVPILVLAIGIMARSRPDSRSYATTTIVCGVIALIFAWLMIGVPNGSYIGLYQRLVEGSILFWVFKTAMYVRNKGMVLDSV